MSEKTQSQLNEESRRRFEDRAERERERERVKDLVNPRKLGRHVAMTEVVKLNDYRPEGDNDSSGEVIDFPVERVGQKKWLEQTEDLGFSKAADEYIETLDPKMDVSSIIKEVLDVLNGAGYRDDAAAILDECSASLEAGVSRFPDEIQAVALAMLYELQPALHALIVDSQSQESVLD